MATMESKLKIKAVQTVIPMKPTNPRQPLPISISENVGSSIYKSSLNLVFCYNKASEEHESGSLVAGWIKESLGMALSQKPILAGRLRKKDDGVLDEGEMEIVPNDSGIRLIEAQIDVSLKEFLDLKNKEDDEDVLVFWKDIDHEMNPQFSPLVYIQVTSFSCSGYSIGISCSLILIDPLSLINFLKTWTNIHLKLISNSQNTPLFYRPNHVNINNPSLNQSIGPTSKRACNTQTTIFKILNSINNKTNKNLVEMCINEAEKRIGKKPTSSRNVLLIKESIEDEIKIRRFDREVIGGDEKPFIYKHGIIDSGEFDDFGEFNDFGIIDSGEFDDFGEFNDISFSKDCKPTYCSWWIKLEDDEAVVMVIPSLEIDGSRMKIIAALPLDN